MRNRNFEVISSQTDVHPNIAKVLSRRGLNEWKGEISDEAKVAYKEIKCKKKKYKGIILDIMCGDGMSTKRIAEGYKEHYVVGIDHGKVSQKAADLPPNADVIRADAWSIIALAQAEKQRFSAVYCLYPNPAPKAKRLNARVYMHPLFPALLTLTDGFKLRTNWEIAARECAVVMRHYGYAPTVTQITINEPMTRHEAKYAAAGQAIWQVKL